MAFSDITQQDIAPGEDRASLAKTIVKPVANAVRILQYLSQFKEGGATQIARTLKINPSTCYNILRTLYVVGVLDFDPPSKTYSTGVGMLKLVDGALTEGRRLDSARPVLREIADRFLVTSTLWRRVGERLVLVAAEDSPHEVRIHMAPGQRVPHLVGATGRLVAQELGLTKRELSSALREVRWARPVAVDDYWEEIQQAAKRGYAIDNGYFAPGVITLAAPIYDPSGVMTMGLGSVLFTNQFQPEGLDALGKELKRFAARLSETLF